MSERTAPACRRPDLPRAAEHLGGRQRIELGQPLGRLDAKSLLDAFVVGDVPECLGGQALVKIGQVQGRLITEVALDALVVGDVTERLGGGLLVNPG